MHKYNVTAFNRPWRLIAPLLLAACAGNPTPPDPAPSEPQAAPQPAAQPAPEPRQAQGVPMRDDAPLRYVVKKGDTLWDIADHFLKDPWYWPELWHANPDIENPHLIYPGDVLYLVWEDGKPQLRRAKRLSPKVRKKPIDAAIPTIPLDAIQQFLDGPRLVTADELDSAPYILEFLDRHLMGSAGDSTYVRGVEEDKGNAYRVFRPGETYRDPETDELLGYEAVPVGRIELHDFDNIATGTLTKSTREAMPGDRLLPLETEALASDFYPQAPGTDISGRIISVYDGVSEIGQYEIVAINRGQREGLQRGHVLSVYQAGREATDPVSDEKITLPPIKAGTVMLFKVEERVGFGLVMRANRSINVMDEVRTPEG